jgi:hypothetical protein
MNVHHETSVMRQRVRMPLLVVPAVAVLVLAGWAALPKAASAAGKPFINQLSSILKVSTTVPLNGDVNPYGVAVVPTSTGKLVSGDVLVSNFNSKANVQGTGTTIVEVSPAGTDQVFANVSSLPTGMECPGGVGLSTALDILPGGWVVDGSLPTLGGALPMGDPVGCLIVLDSSGVVAETISNAAIAGPWDMTATSTANSAVLYVSNALGGNTKVSAKSVPVTGLCTVARIDLALSSGAPPRVTNTTIVGKSFPWKANPAALVLAPTGLALSGSTLYVDNTLNDTVAAIPNAAARTSAVSARSGQIAKGGALNAPLGMTVAPNGDLLIVNGNDGNLVELSTAGKQVAKRTLIKKGAGDLFGLAVTPNAQGLYFVDDGANTLEVAQPE